MTACEEMEEQLRQAQKMEAVGRLAGGVAHDFNNLLAVIAATRAPGPEGSAGRRPAVDRSVRQIQTAAERAAALTRQLLAFSSPADRSSPEVLDLNSAVRRPGQHAPPPASARTSSSSRTPASDLGRVDADPGQIEQVLINLAVNARDAMPRGGHLTIETRERRARRETCRDSTRVTPVPYVMLAVTDTGIGMDKKTQERIFEPFFTTKEKGKGTGLGLSTVYGIVRHSPAGDVWVYSEPGLRAPPSRSTCRAPRSATATKAKAAREWSLCVVPTSQLLVVEDEAQRSSGPRA